MARLTVLKHDRNSRLEHAHTHKLIYVYILYKLNK